MISILDLIFIEIEILRLFLIAGENSREKNVLLPIVAVIRFIDQSGTVLIFLLAILEKKLKGQFFLSSQRKK